MSSLCRDAVAVVVLLRTLRFLHVSVERACGSASHERERLHLLDWSVHRGREGTCEDCEGDPSIVCLLEGGDS